MQALREHVNEFGLVSEYPPCRTFRAWRMSRNLTINALGSCVGYVTANLSGYSNPLDAIRDGLSIGAIDIVRLSQWESGQRLPSANGAIILTITASLYDKRDWAIADLFPETPIDWSLFFRRSPKRYDNWVFWERDIEIPMSYSKLVEEFAKCQQS